MRRSFVEEIDSIFFFLTVVFIRIRNYSFVTDFYDRLPLDRHSVKPWNSYQGVKRSNEDSNHSEDEGRQSQMMLQMSEDIWQLENQTQMALEVEKIEEDVRAVNEIFRDLATMIHVSHVWWNCF